MNSLTMRMEVITCGCGNLEHPIMKARNACDSLAENASLNTMQMMRKMSANRKKMKLNCNSKQRGCVKFALMATDESPLTTV